MVKTEQQIMKYLESFHEEIVALALQLRIQLKKETKPAFELVGDSTISLNIGYGFTEKAWDCFCAIIVYSKHINLSFNAGAFLPDPQRLLNGTGKKIRHIKIKDFDDINKQSVKVLLNEARKRAIALLDEKPGLHQDNKTIIKPISGIKKRSK